MKIRKLFRRPGKISYSLILLPVMLAVFYFGLQISYDEIRKQTMSEYNQQLSAIAKTAAEGITFTIEEMESDLELLAGIQGIIALDDLGKQLLSNYLDKNDGLLTAITRIDTNGVITFTYPASEQATGRNISGQDHVKEVLATKKSVVSDVFVAQQGYQAIAIHVPVYDGKTFAGSVAVLIPIDYLGRRYFRGIDLGGGEYVWLLSENGIELFCPNPGHTGQNFLKNNNSTPLNQQLLKTIRLSNSGLTQYSHTRKNSTGEVQTSLKNAAFYRIPILNTYWIILISYEQAQVYAELSWLRARFIGLFVVIFIVLGYYFYSVTKMKALISEQRKRINIEEKLLDTEARFTHVFESASDGILVLDNKTNVLYVNPAFTKATGIDKEELLGRNGLTLARKFADKETLPALIKLIQNLIAGKKTSILEIKHNDRFLEISTSIHKSHNFIVGVFRDVTATKKFISELKENEEKYQVLSESTYEAIFLSDKGICISQNKTAENLFGYTFEEAVGKPGTNWILPDDRALVKKKMMEDASDPYEVTALRKDGSTFPCEIQAKAILHKGKRVRITALRDITARKAAQRALIESEKKYRNLIETTSEGFWQLNNENKTVDVNEAACKLLGYGRDEIIGKSPLIFFDEENQKILSRELSKIPDTLHRNYEISVTRKDGTQVEVLLNATTIKGSNGIPQGSFALIKDISNIKQKERALRESQNTMLKVAENMPNSYLSIIEKDMTIGFTAGEEFTKTGLDPDRFIGIKLDQVFGDKTAFVKSKYLKTFAGEPQEFEMFFNNQHQLYKVVPLFSDDGSILRILAVVENITDRKIAEKNLIHAKEKIEESEQKYRALYENAPLAYQSLNIDGKLLDINPKWTSLLGYERNEVIGHWFGEFLHKDYVDNFRKKFPIFKKQGYISDVRFKMVRKDLREIFVSFEGCIGYTATGDFKQTYCTFKDITTEVKAKNELVFAKERAEESDRLKSAFLANMSHEIRTPMNGILGFAELLKEPDISHADKDSYISIIEKSGQRMLNIINDLIDISKIESGQMEVIISETDFHKQAAYLCTFFKPEMQQKGINFICKNPDFKTEEIIRTDREKLYAILTNLLKNAIKYTQKGAIEFGYTFKENDHGQKVLNAWVKDTGIGIPANRLDAVFERFVQADLEDKNAMEGAGLGLAISKAYAEMLGGTITVESHEGKGSTFHLTIPDQQTERSTPQEDITKESDKLLGTKKYNKVLVVEDDADSRLHLSIILKRLFNEIIFEVNGNNAVDRVKHETGLNLILMDIKLPGLNGFEATMKIRNFNKNIPIIAQTAYALSGDREKALEAGCNDYIAKPINKGALLEKINMHLQKI